jgi:CRISPR-associated protein Cas1
VTNDGHELVPPLIPVRRLNGYVFCPRLFYLQWVDDQWVDTLDTDSGTYVHRRVDRKDRGEPNPQSEQLTRTRSLHLSSETLGLVGVVDIVESGDGVVRPVEFKSSRPAPTDSGIWPPEEVQITAHAMMLREAGYSCDAGAIYFNATRERRLLEVTPQRVHAVREAIAGARQVATSMRAPLPLIDDPRCSGCSMVGICLPDETAQ